MEPSEALREWHDFYVLIGTASSPRRLATRLSREGSRMVDPLAINPEPAGRFSFKQVLPTLVFDVALPVDIGAAVGIVALPSGSWRCRVIVALPSDRGAAV